MAVIKDRYQLDLDINGASQALGNFKGLLRGLGPVIAGAFAADAVLDFGKAIVANTKQFEQYTNQLRLITASQQELDSTLVRLQQSARANRSEFGATVDLYTKLSLATESLGKSQDEVLNVTQKFQQALAISGADANTASGAIRQFGQAMASGTVRGDEFVSIVEALGPALSIMARESGLTVGELRQMSQAGELTADTFFEMVAASESLTAAFNSMETTTDQLETKLTNTFERIALKIDEALGITETYRGTLRELDRDLGNLFNVNPIENLTDDQVLSQAREGLLSVDDALFEIKERIAEFPGLMNLFTGKFVFDEDQAAFDNIKAVEAALKDMQTAAQETAQTMNEAAAADRKAAAARTAALAPLQDLIDRNEQYIKQNEKGRSTLDRLRESQSQVTADIQRLTDLRGTEIEQYINLDGLIAAATTRNDQLTASINRLTSSTQNNTSFSEYYKGLIESSSEAVRETSNAQEAIGRLNEDLASRSITIDQYAEAMDRVNATLGLNGRATDETNNKIQTYDEYLKTLGETISSNIREERNRNRALADLRMQFREGGLAVEYYKAALELLDDTYTDIGSSEERYEAFNRRLNTTVRESIDTDIFKQRAMAQVRDQLESNIITTAEYERYMDLLDDSFKTAAERAEDLETALAGVRRETENYQSAADSRVAEARNAAELSGLKGIERELRSIQIQERDLANEAKRRVAEQLGENANAGDLANAYARIDAAMQRNIQVRSQMITYIDDQKAAEMEAQRTFEAGWEEAFENYQKAATNSAEAAGRIFDKVTSGMEDAIVGFAKTGKFEWKGFVASIAEEILRSNVRRLISGLFGGFGGGSGGGSSNFAGFFANGGTIPAGQFGIAGEAGPEIITGPATVTPMSAGGGSVSYYINAVDAPSFQQLIARDPKFIHAVAEKGRQGVSGVRR